MTDIGNAMKHGNAQTMSKFFDAEIEITFLEKSKKFTRSSAQKALQTFFSKIEPKNYEPWDKGNSYNRYYYVGYLHTSNKVYRVYMLFVQKGNNWVMQELRFEN